MIAVVCRVARAAVTVEGRAVGAIDRGLLVYVGVERGDGDAQVEWMSRKLPALRIFADEQDRMNRSVADVGGSLLLIPNFTLAARTGKGTRPSFADAAEPAVARALFEKLVARCGERVPAAGGRFGADMSIESLARGPVNLVLRTP